MHPLKWECVGGSVLKGEDSLTGALRETKEEVGLSLDPEFGKLVRSTIGRVVNGVKFSDIVDVWLFKHDGPESLEIESRLEDSDCTIDNMKAENRKYIEGFQQAGENIVFLGNKRMNRPLVKLYKISREFSTH